MTRIYKYGVTSCVTEEKKTWITTCRQDSWRRYFGFHLVRWQDYATENWRWISISVSKSYNENKARLK